MRPLCITLAEKDAVTRHPTKRGYTQFADTVNKKMALPGSMTRQREVLPGKRRGHRQPRIVLQENGIGFDYTQQQGEKGKKSPTDKEKGIVNLV